MLKGMGARTAALVGSLAVEASVVALVASIIGSVVAVVLAPAFPLSAEIPTAAFLLLPALSVAVAVLGSVGAVRHLVSVQPALSFRS